MHGLQEKVHVGRLQLVALAAAFFLDRIIKHDLWFATRSGSDFLIHPELNVNIAFSLPLPSFFRAAVIPVLLCICLGLLIASVRAYRRDAPTFFWWGLLAAGALSNVLDRILLGGVLDYFDLGFFPVFNLSDAYIVVALCAFIILDWRSSRTTHS